MILYIDFLGMPFCCSHAVVQASEQKNVHPCKSRSVPAPHAAWHAAQAIASEHLRHLASTIGCRSAANGLKCNAGLMNMHGIGSVHDEVTLKCIGDLEDVWTVMPNFWGETGNGCKP